MKNYYKNMCLTFVGKTSFLITVFTCLMVFSESTKSQTVLVNYAFNDAVAGTPCNAGTSNAAPGVTPTFSTSTGACTTPGGTVTTGTALTQNATAGSSTSITGFATGSTNYFQFQLGGVGSFQNYQVYFQAQRSGTGPTAADLQYSTDGTNFTSFQTVVVPTAFAPSGAFNFDLSAISAIEGQTNVYFRIVASGGSNATGTFRIDNFQVQGQLATSANSSIAGRVSANGKGISRTMVMLSGGNLEEPLYATTNSFGNYNFSDLPVGEIYVITVMSKKYSFSNPSLIINLNESIANADFEAQQN